jgi:hypothetical protein
MLKIQPTVWKWGERQDSTYRTIPIWDYDPEKSLVWSAGNVPCPYRKNVTSWCVIFNLLMTTSIFESHYLESTVCTKIHGNSGYFYDWYQRIGIVWKRSKQSKVYNVNFICHQVPWSVTIDPQATQITEPGDIWNSHCTLYFVSTSSKRFQFAGINHKNIQNCRIFLYKLLILSSVTQI